MRGRLIDDRNRKTKKTGNMPCTASPLPVRRATTRPRAPKPSVISIERATITSTPAKPAAKCAPTAAPTIRNATACTSPSIRLPVSRPTSSAQPRSGVSARRLRKPVSMSRAMSVPELITPNSAPCRNGIASAKVTNESVGNPGSWVTRWSPDALMARSISGKISEGMICAGWRNVRNAERRATCEIWVPTGTLTP